MEDADGLTAKKEMLLKTVEQCNDLDMLDLVYKLLLTSIE